MELAEEKKVRESRRKQGMKNSTDRMKRREERERN
jgi:hypothetical protein